jgi:HK97 family phage major capsid protein
MFAQRIRELKAQKSTHEAQMQAVATKAATEGRTMDAGEQEAFDSHLSDGQTIQQEIDRLEAAASMSEKAVAVATEKTAGAASASRSVATQVQVKQLPKGTGFARYAMALAATKGSISDALRFAERWKSSTPEVMELLEKANPGTTADSTFAAPLVYAQNLVAEFIELLRPATVLGRIPGIRYVPFNVRIARQTAGMGAFNWVGEGAAKPVGELDFDTVTLAFHKIAGIVVLTDELVKYSSPNAEDVVRTDLVEQMARFIDVQFLRLTVASGASNPASITNGVTPINATGDDADALEADLFNALAPFDDTNVGDNNVTLVMQPKLARSIGLLRPDVGNGRLYPELTQRGGSLLGYPVITSNSVDNGFIVLVKGDEILVADDGSVALDASREATIDAAGGNSPALSLWQKNLVGLRAERGITWKKRRTTGSVSLIAGAYYGPATVADS